MYIEKKIMKENIKILMESSLYFNKNKKFSSKIYTSTANTNSESIIINNTTSSKIQNDYLFKSNPQISSEPEEV